MVPGPWSRPVRPSSQRRAEELEPETDKAETLGNSGALGRDPPPPLLPLISHLYAPFRTLPTRERSAVTRHLAYRRGGGHVGAGLGVDLRLAADLRGPVHAVRPL